MESPQGVSKHVNLQTDIVGYVKIVPVGIKTQMSQNRPISAMIYLVQRPNKALDLNKHFFSSSFLTKV